MCGDVGDYRRDGSGFVNRRMARGAAASRDLLGFGCLYGDLDLDGYADLPAVNGHIDASVRKVGRKPSHAQVPQLFLNARGQGFRDLAVEVGGGFAAPKVGRGLAFGDFDRDGDLDVRITTNGGRAQLYRNDLANGHHSIRFVSEGRQSNRDAIGAGMQAWWKAGRSPGGTWKPACMGTRRYSSRGGV